MPQLVGPVSPSTVAVRPEVWKKLRKVGGYMEEYVKDYKSPEATGFFLAYVTRNPGGEGFHFLSIDGRTGVYKSYGGEGRKYFGQVLQREFNKYFSARNNPLVEWDRQYSGTVGSGDYYYGPMLKADAEEKFRNSMAVCDQVLESRGLLPLPLSLLIRPSRSSAVSAEDEVRAGQIGAKTKSVVLVEYVYARDGGRASKPGDPNRETPHTLFNVLHRLCEFISQPGRMRDGKLLVNPNGIGYGDIGSLPCLSPSVAANFKTAVQVVRHGAAYIHERLHGEPSKYGAGEYVRAILSSGLKTASGRLGAIDDTDQALAEAFAKFCLSRESVYDSKVPLTLNGAPLPLSDRDLKYIRKIREIWAEILYVTVDSLVTVFGLFVRGYYTGNTPTPAILPDSNKVSAYFKHSDGVYEHLNNNLPKGLVDRAGRPLSFVQPRTYENYVYAAELHEAVSALFVKPSTAELTAAHRVVYEALHSLLSVAESNALKRSGPGGSTPEYSFLREKYARPRNTPQSIAKAQRVNAALDVLEARSKPRPGLNAVFIQPNE